MERERFGDGGFRIVFLRGFLCLLLVTRLPASELSEEAEDQSGSGGKPSWTVAVDGDQAAGGVTVRVGSNLTLSCVVDVLDLQYEVLRVNLLQGRVVLPMVENGLVHSPFSGIARYSVQMVDQPGGGVSMTISVNDIQPEDTGTYICYKYQERENSASFNVTVLVPVTDLYVTSIFPDGEEVRVEEDGEVVLQEHDYYGVGCVAVAEGSAAVPSMRVLIDGMDATHAFQRIPLLDDVVLESGLTLWTGELRLLYLSTEPDPDLNEKQIRCVARQRGFSEIEATALLFVQFSPLIRCSQERIVARIGTSAVFDCHIRANPGSRITWYSARGDLSSYPNVFFDETILGTDETHLRLSVRNVKKINYQKYTLIAANIVGSSQVTFELVEDPTVLSERHQEEEEEEVEESVQPDEEAETAGPGFLDAALSEEVQPPGERSVVVPDVTKPAVDPAVITSAADHQVAEDIEDNDPLQQPPDTSPSIESVDDGRNIDTIHRHHHHHHQQQQQPRKDTRVGETKSGDTEDDLSKKAVASSSSSSSSSSSFEAKDFSEDIESPPLQPPRVHYSHSQSSSSSSSSKGKSYPTSSGTIQSPGIGTILPVVSLASIARLL